MIAVLVYIFNTEIWDEMLPLLLRLKNHIHIDIALCKDNDNSKIENDLESFNLIAIRYVENKGADIGPFLLQISELDQDKYAYFIKLHSKKSLIGKFEWKYILFNTLIGSEQTLLKNKQVLDTDNSIGAITDIPLIMKSVGNNKKHIEIICKILNISSRNKEFMAGSMFMARSRLFAKYFTKNFVKLIYPMLETGKVSDLNHGTLCHALERIFGKIVTNEKQKIGFVKSKPDLIIYNRQRKAKYPIYKCYNNYCYNRSSKNLLFGYIYNIINMQDSLVIDWKYLKDDSYLRRYDKMSDGIFIGR